MFKIKSIASSSKGNCYLISDGETDILIECGLSFRKIKEALNFNTSSLSGIIATHEHGDHFKGAADAMKSGLDVYATKGTFDAVAAYGRHAKDIVSGKQFNIGSLTILPFDTVHDCAEPVGFLVANKQHEKLLFLTDTAYCKYQFKGVTHLIIECNFSDEIINSIEFNPAQKRRLINSHMSLGRVIDFLEVNDLSCLQEVYLIHLSDGNSDEKLFKESVQAVTGVPVYVCVA